MTSHRFSRRPHSFDQRSRQTTSLDFQRGIRRKLLCVVLVLALLSLPGFDIALQQTPVLASSAVNSAASSFSKSLNLF